MYKQVEKNWRMIQSMNRRNQQEKDIKNHQHQHTEDQPDLIVLEPLQEDQCYKDL